MLWNTCEEVRPCFPLVLPHSHVYFLFSVLLVYICRLLRQLLLFRLYDIVNGTSISPLQSRLFLLLLLLAIFRWFKFTLKPPYRIANGNFFSAIWDTSHWNFLVKFGLKTAWDMSYDILLSLLKFVLATPGPFEYFGQNWVSSENQSFLDEGATGLRCDLGVLGSQITRLYDGTIFGGGATDLRGSCGPLKKLKLKNCIFRHICDGLKGIWHWLISSRISP